MRILEQHSITDFSGIRIGGEARFFGMIESHDDLQELWNLARSKKLPLRIIGQGTGVYFSHQTIPCVIGVMCSKSIQIRNHLSGSVHVEIQAGEDWDDVVDFAVQEKLYGIELLSGIPGSAGAAASQNITAYGAQLADVFVNARVFDTQTGRFHLIGLSDMNFGYRSSICTQHPHRFIITSFTIELQTKKPPLSEHPTIKKYFEHVKRSPSLKQIRKAILGLRNSQYPHPRNLPNIGVVFKNPILPQAEASIIIRGFPKMKYRKMNDGKVKLYASELISASGYIVNKESGLSLHKHNAAILTNNLNTQPTAQILEETLADIRQHVNNQFSILLEVDIEKI